METSTRATLLERLRHGGDSLAWEEFFRSYWPSMFAFARRRGCSEQTAEDVVQEVMLAVFQQRDVFRYDPARGRFRNWLGTLVRNKVAECRRRASQRLRAKDPPRGSTAMEAEGHEPTAEDAWEAAFENALLLVLLETVRREVDPRTYLAFELSTLDELRGSEVARITGLSRNAVYKAGRRVRRRLEELGCPYRERGRLHQRIKGALKSFPHPVAERSLTARVEETMRSRRESLNR